MMRKRLEKLEERMKKESAAPFHIPTIMCWNDGTPENEEEARKYAEAMKNKPPGKGIKCIQYCSPWMPGQEQTEEHYRRNLEDEC
jgi:hypothetical protein